MNLRKLLGNLLGKQRPAKNRSRVRLTLEALEDRTVPANITWGGGGPDNLASDQLNWVGGVTPGSMDTIIFDGTSSKAADIDPAFTGSIAAMQIAAGYNSSIALGEDFTVTGGLADNGSSFTGTGNLTVDGASTVTGNVTVGTGGVFTVASGTLNYGGGGILTVQQGGLTVNNGATLTMTGGAMLASNGATITNNGNFNLQGDNIALNAQGNGNSFVNNGPFEKSQTLLADISQVNIPFTNNNNLQVQTGVVFFNSNFVMNQNQARITVQASGDGEVRGNQMNVSAGQLLGDGTLRITAGGQSTWQTAGMNGSGNVIVDGGTLNIVGAFADSGFTITNNNMVQWKAGDITLNNGATINNQPNATLQALCHNSVTSTAGAATFNNYGTFQKIQGPNQGFGWTIVAVPFNSVTQPGQGTSQVNAQFGLIRLQKNGTFQANLTSAAGAEVDFDGGFLQNCSLLDGTTFSAAGSVRVTNSSMLTLASGAKVISIGGFDIGGGVVNNQGVGFLSGNGVFQNTGTTNWRIGTLFKLLQFQNQGTMNITSENALSPPTLNSSVLTNSRTITWTGGDIVMTSVADPTYLSEIQNSGLFDVQTTATMRNSGDTPGKDFLNQVGGLFRKSAGLAPTTIAVDFITSGAVNLGGFAISFAGPSGFTQNAGSVDLADGTLTANFYVFNSGTARLGRTGAATLNVTATGITIPQGDGNVLGGVGTINGNVTNNATIDVGYFSDPVGTITINGNFTQTTTATLKLRLQAAMAGSYDSLTISAVATLAGNLVVKAQAGFNPAAGNQFTILSYQQVFGDFNRPYTLPDLIAPLTWAPASPGNASLVLTVMGGGGGAGGGND